MGKALKTTDLKQLEKARLKRLRIIDHMVDVFLCERPLNPTKNSEYSPFFDRQGCEDARECLDSLEYSINDLSNA